MSNIKKNFMYNTIYQILIIILPLILTPYISRVMGAEKLGIYSYSYSISSCFALICLLGVSEYGNRSIARVRGNKQELNKTFWSIYFMQLITSIVSIALYIVFVLVFINKNKSIFMIQIIYVFSFMIDFNWLFCGLEQFKLTVFRNILVKISSFCCILLFVKSSNDIHIYALIMSLSALISQLICIPYIKRYIGFCKVSISDIIKHIKPNLKLFIPVMSFAIFKMMDKVMLGYMSSMAQVGYYENVMKVIDLPMGLITALGVVMLPRISNMVANGDSEQSLVYLRKSMNFAMFMGCAISFGIASISDIFTPIFFGDEFTVCISLLRWSAPIVIFKSWENVIKTQYLMPNCQDNVYIKSSVIGAILNLLSNLILIPIYGALGAIISSLIGQISMCMYQNIHIHNKVKLLYYMKDSIIYLVFGSIMFSLVFIVGNILGTSITTLAIQIIVGVVSYCILVLLYFMLRKKELLVKLKEISN